MATAVDMSAYTVTTDAELVNVAEFRHRILQLEELVSRDYHACANASERARWAETARRVGSKLISTVCSRAKAGDWDRRERAIDRSTTLLLKVCA